MSGDLMRRRLGGAVVQSRRARGLALSKESIDAATSGDLSLISTADIEDLVSRLEQTSALVGVGLEHAPDARRELMAAGREALHALDRNTSAALTTIQRSALEAIVLAMGRPSILIRNGALSVIPDEWQQLSLGYHVEGFNTIVPSVGRVEVTEHAAGLSWVGTAWMAAESIAITNRHVVEAFADKIQGQWTLRTGMTAAIDFLREDGNVAGPQFAVEEIVAVHEADDVDLALLRLSAVANDGSTALPPPLALESATSAVRPDRRVYTVGYPGEDGRHGKVEDELFRGIYGSKRLAPGAIMRLAPDSFNLLHDCSTLKGSSGSCVVAFENHRVVALHYAGAPFTKNNAVWLAAVKDDPIVRAANLNYQ